jgi:hypothetical protein
MIRRVSSRAKWRSTFDLVEVMDRAPSNDKLWPGQWTVRHMRRTDDAVKLPDGSLVAAEQIDRAAAEAGATHLQLVVDRTSAPATVEVRVLAVDRCDAEHITAAVLHACIELADAYRHNIVTIRVRKVEPDQLDRTPRGKVIRVLERK